MLCCMQITETFSRNLGSRGVRPFWSLMADVLSTPLTIVGAGAAAAWTALCVAQLRLKQSWSQNFEVMPSLRHVGHARLPAGLLQSAPAHAFAFESSDAFMSSPSPALPDAVCGVQLVPGGRSKRTEKGSLHFVETFHAAAGTYGLAYGACSYPIHEAATSRRPLGRQSVRCVRFCGSAHPYIASSPLGKRQARQPIGIRPRVRCRGDKHHPHP